jgi:two-component system copper resistance phosphate regulon response regulator CusR
MEAPHNNYAPRVLVVEDHAKVAEGIRRRLAKEGYDVKTAHSGDAAFTEASSGAFDLVILDLMLPSRSGLEVLGEMRQRGLTTPVLILTARDSLNDRLRGLNGGADDYLVKPFAMPELVARVQALLRRSRQHDIRRLNVGDLELNLISRQASRSGRSIELTPREFELLAYLVSHAGNVVTREMLGRDVWTQLERGTPLDNVIDVHIGRLRRKVDGKADIPLIHTVRGLGFTISLERPW